MNMVSTPSDALTDQEFDDIMYPFKITKPIAVAVSGGIDSIALVFLMHTYAKKHQLSFYTFTVNHNLRSNSAQEAEAVHALLTSNDIHHEILTWKFDEKPHTKIQEQARSARYSLLWQACHDKGVDTLVTAHHLNDQIETFLMRLNHRSGIVGLASMRSETQFAQGKLIRPLLNVQKKQLNAYLQERNMVWFDDPSNKSMEFERIRIRSAIDSLDGNGVLNIKAIGKSIDKIKEVTDFIDTLVVDFFKKNHMTSFSLIDFRAQHIVVQRRIIGQCIQKLSHKYYVSTDESINRICSKMMDDNFKCATLAGLLFKKKSSALVYGAMINISSEKRTIKNKII